MSDDLISQGLVAGRPSPTSGAAAACDGLRSLRDEVLASLEKMRARACCYFGSFCDCKYGGPHDAPGGEQTGCPELRVALSILRELTDDEFRAVYNRPGERYARTTAAAHRGGDAASRPDRPAPNLMKPESEPPSPEEAARGAGDLPSEDVRCHDLKTWHEPFAALWDRRKTFEIRRDDRDYEAGDCLHLREWSPWTPAGATEPAPAGYSGRWINAVVTYKVPGGAWGLPPGLCVLAIRETARAPASTTRSEP